MPVYAHWGKRVGAQVIDGTIATSVVMALVAFSGMTAVPDGLNAMGEPTNTPTRAGAIALIAASIWAVGWQFWNRCIRQDRAGQTVGKSILKIRLVSWATGQPIGIGMAFVRDIAHFVDQICYLGYLWPLWDPRKQTFADKICNTVVVSAID